MGLNIYAGAISAEGPQGVAVTAAFGAATSKAEAEGLALRTALSVWPSSTHRNHKVSVVFVPDEFLAAAGYRKIDG